jgi:uncharacterized coiled-coil DUF342 family protein
MSTDRTTEILNYVSAISREVGALRTEMKTRFEQLETEMLGVKTDMRTGFERLEAEMLEVKTEMRTGFEAVRPLRRKVEIMNQELLDVRAAQRDLEARVDVLERKQA